jgi:hypothetical protein
MKITNKLSYVKATEAAKVQGEFIKSCENVFILL